MFENRPVYGKPPTLNSSDAAFFKYTKGFKSPTPEQISTVLKLHNLTCSAAANLLGVNSRTIRKWTSGEREMPYSSWRLLLIEQGIVDIELR
jgi:DNA-binding transcriptional regulator YiaG